MATFRELLNEFRKISHNINKLIPETALNCKELSSILHEFSYDETSPQASQ
jgi:hypothetical protein